MVEVNQSGLLMETLIDITPKDPLPAPSLGPLHPDCTKEGLILCDKERMKGQQGVSLDALVGIFTRLGRDMEEIGVTKSYKLAEKVASIMEEAQPLLTRVRPPGTVCELCILLMNPIGTGTNYFNLNCYHLAFILLLHSFPNTSLHLPMCKITFLLIVHLLIRLGTLLDIQNTSSAFSNGAQVEIVQLALT